MKAFLEKQQFFSVLGNAERRHDTRCFAPIFLHEVSTNWLPAVFSLHN